LSICYKWVRIFYTEEKFVRTCQKVPFDLIGFSDFPTVQRENDTKQTEKLAPDRLAQEFGPIPSTSEPSTSSNGLTVTDTQSAHPSFLNGHAEIIGLGTAVA
jgi:hypothetical protein